MELEQQFSEKSQLILHAKERSFQAVNRELVGLYWQIGEYVSNKINANS